MDSIEITKDDEFVSGVRLSDIVVDDKKEQATFGLGYTLAVGDQIKLKMSFHGPIYNDLTGLYYSFYSEGDNTK